MSVVLNGGLDIRWPSVADIRFGPHASLAAAKTAVPLSRRAIGLMVMIAGALYWWKSGTADADLVLLETDPGYKVYKAFLSQAGTAAPTVTVVKNTLGAAIVWTRSSIGEYVGTLASAFTAAKTFIAVPSQSLDIADTNVFQAIGTTSTILMTVRTISTQAAVDLGTADAVTVDIIVYN